MVPKETFKLRERGTHAIKGKKGYQSKPNRLECNILIGMTYREREVIRQLAERKGISMTNLVKRAISYYIKNESIEVHPDYDLNQTELDL